MKKDAACQTFSTVNTVSAPLMLCSTIIISTNKGWVGETRHELADFIPVVLTFGKWKWRKGEILEIWGKKEVVVWASAWDRKQPAQLDVGHSLAWKGLVKEGTIGGTPRWAALGPHLCSHLREWCLCSVYRTTCVAEGSNLPRWALEGSLNRRLRCERHQAGCPAAGVSRSAGLSQFMAGQQYYLHCHQPLWTLCKPYLKESSWDNRMVGLLQFTAQLQEHGTFILEAPANGPYTKNNKD